MENPNSTQDELSPPEKRTPKQRVGSFIQGAGVICGLAGIMLIVSWVWEFSQGCGALKVLTGSGESLRYTGPGWFPLVRGIVVTGIGIGIAELGHKLLKSRN